MAKFTRSKAASISLKIIERMINQNTFDDIAQGLTAWLRERLSMVTLSIDFKYWEDAG